MPGMPLTGFLAAEDQRSSMSISGVGPFLRSRWSPMWCSWPFGQAWMCRNLFDEYLFNQDASYLSRIWPIMRDNAPFCIDFLSGDGVWTGPVSVSELFLGEWRNRYPLRKAPVRMPRPSCVICIQLSQASHDLENLDEGRIWSIKANPSVLAAETRLGVMEESSKWNDEFIDPIHSTAICPTFTNLHPGAGITSPDSAHWRKPLGKSLEVRGDDAVPRPGASYGA